LLSKRLPLYSSFHDLTQDVIHCRLCKRLVHYRETVPPKEIYKDENYWRKPVPGFGDPKAWLMLLGLAPSPHGGNRTGRIFTGDATSKFLLHCLYQVGLSNQPTSEYRDDGLLLNGCYMTAAVKCVPPAHKPTREEFLNCSRYLFSEFYLLKNLKVVLALGKSAFDSCLKVAKAQGCSTSGLKFRHGAKYELKNFPTLYASYHPTPRNTNTGTLTESMFCGLLREIQKDSGL
jgi:uracil-DNA glycosylase family 4